MEAINFTDPQPLSDAGRRALESELRELLRNRRRMCQERDRCISDAFGHMVVLNTTTRKCSELCADLGFGSETEAAEQLLDFDNQASYEVPRPQAAYNGETFVEAPCPAQASPTPRDRTPR